MQLDPERFRPHYAKQKDWEAYCKDVQQSGQYKAWESITDKGEIVIEYEPNYSFAKWEKLR
jgi:hypothetical protein